jgi:PEP-CTERM motif
MGRNPNSLLAVATMLVASMVAISSPSFADSPFVDNGAPSSSGGSEMTSWIQAENFTLAGASNNLTGVTFWDLEGNYAGSVSWFIYGDNSGTPGSLLFSGSADPTRTATGVTASLGTEYVDSFAIDVQGLVAGTYWLGLHNGPLSTTASQDFYWETTSNSDLTSGSQYYLLDQNVSWSSTGIEHAFTLDGSDPPVPVPEPGSLMLLGSGFFGLAIKLRGRFRK